jgi:uncharacterized protein YcfJ
MNKQMQTQSILGFFVVTAVVSLVGCGKMSEPDFAQVLSVTPVTEEVRTPREECENVVVTKQKPVKDEHKVAGTLIGAVGGAVIGDAIGGGGKNTGAKIAGAAAGGYAGNRVQNRMQENATYQETERRCRTLEDVSERTVGYDVQYKLRDETGQVRMDYDPGGAIPVRNGLLVLSRAVPATLAEPAPASAPQIAVPKGQVEVNQAPETY